MLKIEDTDFQPPSTFSLNWRWTDSRWNELPESDLRQIKPLTKIKAKEFWRILGHYVLSNGPRINIFECSEWVDATLDVPGAFEKIRSWLLNHLSERDESVIVSWDKDTAVLTNWGIFCDYWDDFCYPSSDDVTVFPLSIGWVLFYDHFERFVFGSRLATAKSAKVQN
jgi:hypothetical protein